MSEKVARLSFKETIVNQAGLENVPAELAGLPEDILDAAACIYGPSGVVAVFMRGSITRGDFVAGMSDADVVVITKSLPAADHKQVRGSVLQPYNQKWQAAGVSHIDMVAMGVQQMDDSPRRRQLMELAVDGVQIGPFAPLDLSRYLPTSRLDWVQEHSGRNLARVGRTRLSELSEADQKHNLVKQLMRSINDIAVLNGADLTKSLPAMEAVVSEYALDFTVDFMQLANFESLELRRMYSIADRVLAELARQGVDFAA